MVEPIVILAAAVLGLPLLAFLVGRAGLLGPLFPFDLLRLTRKGTQIRLRVLFAFLLLIALMLTYLEWMPNAGVGTLFTATDAYLPLNALSKFAESFAEWFLYIQLALVMLLMPAYAAGAISEEKERRTLEYLLASPLSAREIILGKFAARLLHVAGVLLAGLPILMLTLFWGGVEIRHLLIGYGIAFCAAVSTGGIATLIAQSSDDLRVELLRTYAVILIVEAFGWCCCLRPIEGSIGAFSTLSESLTNSQPTSFPHSLQVFVVLHLLVGLACLLTAHTTLRDRPERPVTPTRIPVMPLVPIRDDDSAAQFPYWYFNARPRLEDDDPLLWKERFVRGLPIPVNPDESIVYLLLLCAAPFAFVALLLFCLMVLDDMPIWNGMVSVIRIFGGAGTLWWFGAMGLHAAASVTRERQRGTLTALLMTPVDRTEILVAKAHASVWKSRKVAWFLVGLWTAGLFTGGLHPLSAALAVVTVATLGTFAVVMGMWLSVRCSTVIGATGYFFLGCLITFALPRMAGAVARAIWPDEIASSIIDTFSPPHLWELVTFTITTPVDGRTILQAFVAVLGYAVLARVLWWRARSAFERLEP